MFENEYKMDIRRYQRWTTPIFYKVLSFWPWLFIFLITDSPFNILLNFGEIIKLPPVPFYAPRYAFLILSFASSSDALPLMLILPVSRTYALSDTASAIFAFCSTKRTVIPF